MIDWALRAALQDVVSIIVQPWGDEERAGPGPTLAARYNPPLDPMSLIQAADLRKAYGAQDVLQGISLDLPQQARVALVGPNGIGKSTLLRILAGIEAPDDGRVKRAKRATIGYLPQELREDEDSRTLERSLWQATLEAFAELRQIEQELNELEAAMADPRRAAEAMAKYGPLQEEFERAGGYTYTAEVKRVLRGLGFSEAQFSQRLGALSGGERTRALLARLLLEDPELLILDEPTNHLDIAALEWLEGWLDAWPGAALMVSHDRYFLDRTVDVIWELSERGLETYRGNYSEYAEQRRLRRARHAELYQRQQERVAKEREFIRRNLAGQNTRQAQGRRKRLERFLEQEALSAPSQEREVAIQLDTDRRSGDIVFRARGLTVGRGGETFFSVPDLIVRRAERIAVVGPNGVGKTTLLKTVAGDLPTLAGTVKLGANVQVGYFAQAHEGLQPGHSVLRSMLEADEDMKISTARSWLARFLFRGDDVEKPVADLSGGERGRLALARLARQGANLLLLDEPTTHLDHASQEALQQALSDFPGTIVFISHDRYLIEALATQIWGIRPDDEELQVVVGGYEAYRAAQPEAEEISEDSGGRTERQSPNRDEGPAIARRLERVEDQVEELENSLEKLAREIERSGADVERVRALGEEYAELEAALQERLAEWERLSQAGGRA